MRRVPPADLRFSVKPGDVPPKHAARRMGLSLDAFERALPELLSRGFPTPDRTTGYFDIEAVDLWRRLRAAALFGLTPSQEASPSKTGRSLAGAFRTFREQDDDA